MPVIEPAIRPPAEADSVLLQVTVGCSADGCAFCGAYAGKPFRIKPEAEVLADIEEERRLRPAARRVFLMDGDALVLDNRRLLPILDRLAEAFPSLARVSSYANGFNVTRRSEAELRELRARRLSLIYLGLESGSQAVLDGCRKRSGVGEMIEAVTRADACGIRSSVIVLLGLGGRERSAEHVRETARALNRMQPRYLSFLSLMLIPGTPLWRAARRGEFTEVDAAGLLREARDILAGIELERTVFRCDHASNYLPLEGRLPADRDRLVRELDEALVGRAPLRPEFLRGL
ncbi:MAG: radical SAM protein [bacterium]|nr:radical SAM protein [bacterium]